MRRTGTRFGGGYRRKAATSNVTMSAGDLKKSFVNLVDIPQGATDVAAYPGIMKNMISADDIQLLGNFGSCRLNYVVAEAIGWYEQNGSGMNKGTVSLSYIDGDSVGQTQQMVINKNLNTKITSANAMNTTPITLKVLYKPLQQADKGWIATEAFLTQRFGTIVSGLSHKQAAGVQCRVRFTVNLSCKMDA